LEPRRVVNTNDLLKEAQNLRNRGMSLGAGSAAGPAATAPAPAALPPADLGSPPPQGSASSPP
jgi:hypothetical protein